MSDNSIDAREAARMLITAFAEGREQRTRDRLVLADRLMARMGVLGWSSVDLVEIEPTEFGRQWRATGEIAGERFESTGNSPDGVLYGLHTMALEAAEEALS